MEYLFRLPDGRRLALWNEQHQIVRLVSGAMSRSQTVIRTDFLSDLSAVMYEENIYFVYQNIAGAVMLHAPDEEDVLLLAERLENCRFGGLTLTVWQRRLFLLYIAWNAVQESYSLKLRELSSNGAGDATGFMTVHSQDGENTGETELLSGIDSATSFQVLYADRELVIGMGEETLRLKMDDAGELHFVKGRWISEDVLSDLRERIGEADREKSGKQHRIRELEREVEEKQKQIRQLENQAEEWRKQLVAEQTRLDSAIHQYNELADLTRKLQQEGKNWRNSYYQEVKKRRERSGAVKVKRETPQ